jgi:hypothetical protein
MNGFIKVDVLALSLEARVFRWLVRRYVVRKLRENNMSVLGSLLVDDSTIQSAFAERESVTQDYLSEVFEHTMDQFTADNDAALRSLVHSLGPPALSSITESDMQVLQNVLTVENADWGSMVAITAFLVLVVQYYICHELSEAAVPIIDYAALQSDRKLTPFIRESGGWSAFALALPAQEKNKAAGRGWLYPALAAAATLAVTYGLSMFRKG